MQTLKQWMPTILKVLLVLAFVVAIILIYWTATLPDRIDAQQTIVIGQTEFVPDAEASVRVVVQDANDGLPIQAATVEVSLRDPAGQSIAVYEGRTGEDGSLPVSLSVPADAPPEATLIVHTKSASGSDTLERPVKIERAYRILFSTDKPLYQPGQIIHMRALALSSFDQTPAAGATIDFLVEDAKGNKVFRDSVTASEFGIAAVDFTLATMVNQGNYKLSAAIDETASEKTVLVQPYALPKFGVQAETDRNFYAPGDTVLGTIQADYFFGKPVNDGKVQITGVVYDVDRVEVFETVGLTDDNGTFTFEFNLPDYFAGSGLEANQAQLGLEVTVVDQTNHPEQTSLTVPVSEQPIVLEAIPESGDLRPGVENIVYVLSAYPDGTPAQTTLQYAFYNPAQSAAQEMGTVETGEFGLAALPVTPQDGQLWLSLGAQDATGAKATREIELGVAGGSDHVLLRADRATYAVGDTMNLTVLTAHAGGAIYLDIIKDGQTISTRSQPVTAGQALFAIDLDATLYGSLALHAYKVLPDGSLVRDTRVVVVNQPRDIDITVSPNKDTYLPGETANIALQTQDADTNTPLSSALGVAIVDESVFALQQQDPGFAKLYFMLEAELMTPFYQIKGFSLPTPIDSPGAPVDDMRAAQDTGAKAAWADAAIADPALQINTRPEKLAAVGEAQDDGFSMLMTALTLALLLVPLLLWVVVIMRLRGSGLIQQSLLGLAKVSGLLIVALLSFGGILYLFDEIPELRRLVRNLDLDEIFPWVFVFVLGLFFVFMAVYAWQRRDESAKFLVLLSLAWVGFIGLIVFISENYYVEPPLNLMVWVLVLFALVPGAFLLFGQMLWRTQRRGGGMVASILGGLLAVPAIVFLLLGVMATEGFAGGMGGAPMAANREEMVFEMADGVMEAPTAMQSKAADEGESAQATGDSSSAEAPRLRQFFPETLYWNPEVVTDEAGAATITLPMADSITTWRLTALASSQDGRLGFTTHGIRVFQDFFVDIDLPVALTQDDEISIPVGVFNYLPDTQDVRLVVAEEPWFELLGPTEVTLTIAPNDIEVVYFPIRVRTFGLHGFEVTAWGTGMNDAIRRAVRVLPNGQEVRHSESDWLRESKTVALNIPPAVIPRTPRVEVKIYTGVLAQVTEGLEKILRLPHG